MFDKSNYIERFLTSIQTTKSLKNVIFSTEIQFRTSQGDWTVQRNFTIYFKLPINLFSLRFSFSSNDFSEWEKERNFMQNTTIIIKSSDPEKRATHLSLLLKKTDALKSPFMPNFLRQKTIFFYQFLKQT